MLKTSKISFPGLGIGEFTVDSVAFSIGDVDIAWYALIITLGMILAVTHLIFRAKQVGISVDTILDYVLITIPVGIIGARLYYVIFSPGHFDSFYDVINIREGGLAIYGGILAGALSVFVISKVKKIPFLTLADTCTPGIILAQGVGRWGNFMNGEAYGGVTDIFCRMGLNNGSTSYLTEYVHPTFLYESLWNILGFIIANLFHKKRQFDGQVFLFVFGWYGLGRAFIEGLRTDSLYLTVFGVDFRASQLLAIIILTLCVAFMAYMEYRIIFKKEKFDLYYHSDKYSLKRK